MHTVTVSTYLPAAPDDVWYKIGNPGAISAWHPVVAESSSNGTERHCILANGAAGR